MTNDGRLNPIPQLGLSTSILTKFKDSPEQLYAFLEMQTTQQTRFNHPDKHIGSDFAETSGQLFRDLDPVRRMFQANKNLTPSEKVALVTDWLDDLAGHPEYADNMALLNMNGDLQKRLKKLESDYSKARMADLATQARTDDTQISIRDLVNGLPILTKVFSENHCQLLFNGDGVEITHYEHTNAHIADFESIASNDLWMDPISSNDPNKVRFYQPTEKKTFQEGLRPVALYKSKVIKKPKPPIPKNLEYDDSDSEMIDVNEFRGSLKTKPLIKLTPKFIKENAGEFRTSVTAEDLRKPEHIVFAKEDSRGRVTYYLSGQIMGIKGL